MKKRFLWFVGLFVFTALFLHVQPALAHESITVGDYTLEVGWLSEPPIVGQQNAIVVNVSKGEEEPVEDVSSLTVTVSYGGQEKNLTLQPLGEDTPGQFVAPILPTVPGQYALKLGGTLGDTAVDAEVEPEEVQSADTLQFPSEASEAGGAPAEQSPDLGAVNWLIYLSLLIGLIALVLGVMALRKSR
jgi:hypothetical protein